MWVLAEAAAAGQVVAVGLPLARSKELARSAMQLLQQAEEAEVVLAVRVVQAVLPQAWPVARGANSRHDRINWAEQVVQQPPLVQALQGAEAEQMQPVLLQLVQQRVRALLQ